MWDLYYTHKYACVSYTWRGVRHKQVCTRVDSEGLKKNKKTPKQLSHPAPPGDRTQGLRNLIPTLYHCRSCVPRHWVTRLWLAQNPSLQLVFFCHFLGTFFLHNHPVLKSGTATWVRKNTHTKRTFLRLWHLLSKDLGAGGGGVVSTICSVKSFDCLWPIFGARSARSKMQQSSRIITLNKNPSKHPFFSSSWPFLRLSDSYGEKTEAENSLKKERLFIYWWLIYI